MQKQYCIFMAENLIYNLKKMNRIFLIVIFLICYIPNSFSQKTLSDYSYVIVSEQFSFQDEKDKYELNSLTKFLFNKHGFHAYFNREVPSNVKRCDGLWADAEGSPGFIYTKLEVVLTDCNGKEVFRTAKGSSKVKDYKKAYYESMRKAFKSLESLRVNQKEIDDGEELISVASNTKEDIDNSKIVIADTIKESNTTINSPELNEVNELEELKLEPIAEKPVSDKKIETPELVVAAVIVDADVKAEKDEVSSKTEAITETPQTTAKENLPSSKYSSYSHNNKTFLLRKTSNGYSFYEENANSGDDLLLLGKIELFADTVIFIELNSNKLAAYFDSSKNLFVIKDSKTTVYKLVD